MTEVQGKRVLIVGLGRSGLAVAQMLARRGAIVTVSDLRPPSEFHAEIPRLVAQKIGLELGVHREETFLRQDLIVTSPGVYPEPPALEAARRQTIPVLPEIEVASWFLRATLVGITGTNGKTTTTVLLGKMLEASGFPTFVGGNIGRPLSLAVDHITENFILVVELSSFQLENIRAFRPHVAVLLNLASNHLDRHPGFEAYVRAKAQIFVNQRADDYAILNADDPAVMSLAPAIGSRKIFFSRRQDLPEGVLVANGKVRYRVGNLERPLLETRDIALRGDFNVENVLAAAAAACVLGADFEALRRAVRDFRGVEHRLEFVREVRGVEFYNDSKATSVDAALKALSVFDRGVHLILGGKDKGAPYAPLRSLLEGRVRSVYLIGAAAERIARELAGAAELIRAGTLERAVHEAFERAVPGDTILLAPACSSFDQFRDFEERGRMFKTAVKSLAERHEGVVGRSSAGPSGSSQDPLTLGPSPEVGASSDALTPGAQRAGLSPPGTVGEEGTNRPRAGPDDPTPASAAAKLESAEVGQRELISESIYVYEVSAEESLSLVADASGVDTPEACEVMPEPPPPAQEANDQWLPFEVRAGAFPEDAQADSPRLSPGGVPTGQLSAPQCSPALGAAAGNGTVGLPRDKRERPQ